MKRNAFNHARVAALFVALLAVAVWRMGYFDLNVDKQHAGQDVIPVTNEIGSGYVVSEPNYISIELLGIKAPIIYVSESSEEAFQHSLRYGVVHFPGTAQPGEYGNCYIFGHSSDYPWAKGDYKTVFRKLPDITKGSEVVVTDGGGVAYVYIVKDSFEASAKDIHLLDQGDRSKKLLTLQTSYPIGTALKRWIVVAEIK